MNQEEADQDLANEVSEEVDSRLSSSSSSSSSCMVLELLTNRAADLRSLTTVQKIM